MGSITNHSITVIILFKNKKYKSIKWKNKTWLWFFKKKSFQNKLFGDKKELNYKNSNENKNINAFMFFLFLYNLNIKINIE